MKVFISQPMGGLSKEEILETKEKIVFNLNKTFSNVEIIDSFIEHENTNCSSNFNLSLCLLGESLELMAEAELVVMATGWQNSRGCRIENTCAREYGIPVLFYKD